MLVNENKKLSGKLSARNYKRTQTMCMSTEGITSQKTRKWIIKHIKYKTLNT